MDKRVKFSMRTKVTVVRSILSGKESFRSAARKLECSKNTVRAWFLLFQQHGIEGLSTPVRKHSDSFKVEVIQHMLENKLSLVRAAACFRINISVLHHWMAVFKRLGPSGLQQDKRGSIGKLMTRKKNTKNQTSPTVASEDRLAALQKEVEFLRAENAFLKKLDALIQQENAAKAQSKQQKPFRN